MRFLTNRLWSPSWYHYKFQITDSNWNSNLLCHKRADDIYIIGKGGGKWRKIELEMGEMSIWFEKIEQQNVVTYKVPELEFTTSQI